MEKSTIGCIGGAMLVASLSLNVALVTGCVSINGDPPFIHTRRAETSESSHYEGILKKERVASMERLRDIANVVGIDSSRINDEVVLKGEIMRRLLDGRVSVPACELDKADLDRIEKELTKNELTVKEACEFVMKLKGKKVLVLGAEGK